MARGDRRSKVDDYYRQVADRLIAQIERGTAPWTQAWQPGTRKLPSNVKTGKPYRGMNSVDLASAADQRGYADQRWGTFKQVRDMDGRVRRGEKGVAILYWRFEVQRKLVDPDGRPVTDSEGRQKVQVEPLRSPQVFRYTVFNAEQCDGLPAPAPAKPNWVGIEAADRVLAASGARIEHSGDSRACFDLQLDRILLPHKERFASAPAYYQTALHELGHWTGHPSRLNRATLIEGTRDGFGSKPYAREELRAEISSMITGDRLELGHDPGRHASYVGNWIQALRDDPREIYRASKDAQGISDYLLAPHRNRLADQERIERPRQLGLELDRAAADSFRRTDPAAPAPPARTYVTLPGVTRSPDRSRSAGPER